MDSCIKIIPQGFLDDNTMIPFEACCVSKNATEFNFANKLNGFTYSIFDLLHGTSKPKELITDYLIANYVLIHKSFQAALILLKKGLSNEAKILLRSILEKLIYIKCVEKDEIYFKIITLLGLKEQLAIVKMIKSGQIKNENMDIAKIETCLNATKDRIISEIQQELGQEYTWKKIKSEFKIRTMAEIAGMTQEYHFMYKALSGQVHPSIGTCVSEFSKDNGFEYDLNATDKDVSQYVQSLSDLLIRASETILNHFDLDTSELKKIAHEEKNIWG